MRGRPGIQEPSQRLLFEMPYRPGEVADESTLAGSGRMQLAIPLRKEGMSVFAVLSFDWVRAYRYTTEPLCRAFQIAPYDKLVEVENSRWVPELVKDAALRGVPHIDLTHYMIYIADEGCYEFAAETWNYRESPADEGH
jgi:hypothetical protein